jgi:two-component system, NarL family, nitrate/nitrite response regulator NarL
MIHLIVLAHARLYRDGLAEVIGRWDGVNLLGAVATFPEAERLLASAQGDEAVVVMDQQLPAGLQTLEALVESQPRCRVIALAAPDDESEWLAWIETGASGFVPRSASLAELHSAVMAVACGELLCSPRWAARLAQRLQVFSRRSIASTTLVLTRREREIVVLIDQGLSNKEIAARLLIELSTVKNHVRHIFEKLKVHRRTEAAAWLGGRLSRMEGSVQAS